MWLRATETATSYRGMLGERTVFRIFPEVGFDDEETKKMFQSALSLLADDAASTNADVMTRSK